MPSPKNKKAKAILLVEDDVIIRLGVAEHLRACGFIVLEAAGAHDARVILAAGPAIDILLSDAQLAGPDTGFAIAQWVRRHRPHVKVILVATTAHKIEAAGSLCAHTPHHDAHTLDARIRAMMAERTRRLRPPAATANLRRRRAT